MNAPNILEVRNLCVTFGAVSAVRDVSLAVPEGSAVALLGANGAGKSSTLRAVAGLLPPTSGEVWFAGQRIDRMPMERLVRRGLAVVTETRDLFHRLTVLGNLRMGALHQPARAWKDSLDEMLGLFPPLERLLNMPAWTLSGGEQQMLALARALLTRPRLLLLDEPSLGLAPIVTQAIFATLSRIVAGGTSLLLIEQSTAAALTVARYGYVLQNGEVALEGTAEALRSDTAVLDLYLGGSELS